MTETDPLAESQRAARERLNALGSAYARTFVKESPLAAQVLQDLAQFCRAFDSTFHPDPRVHAMLEGRREVWLRIQKYLQLSPDDILKLHRRQKGGA